MQQISTELPLHHPGFFVVGLGKLASRSRLVTSTEDEWQRQECGQPAITHESLSAIVVLPVIQKYDPVVMDFKSPINFPEGNI